MKTVATCVKAEDAHVLRMRLENGGIPAVVIDDLTAQAMPHLSTAIGGVKVQVPDDQFHEAQHLLGHDQSAQFAVVNNLVCPRCGSSSIADTLHKQRAYIKSFLMLFLSGLPVPLTKERYQCDHCGHLWK